MWLQFQNKTCLVGVSKDSYEWAGYNDDNIIIKTRNNEPIDSPTNRGHVCWNHLNLSNKTQYIYSHKIFHISTEITNNDQWSHYKSVKCENLIDNFTANCIMFLNSMAAVTV